MNKNAIGPGDLPRILPARLAELEQAEKLAEADIEVLSRIVAYPSSKNRGAWERKA